MEILLVVGLVLGFLLALCLLAALMRVGIVWLAKRNGYQADDMPMHYHMFAFGAYFTILVLSHILYLTLRS
jgi:hypothetical protein